jgi:hypothetical protein
MRRCLILGSALSWLSDVEAALSLSEFEGVVAAKQAGEKWRGRLDAWVTLHPEYLDTSYRARKQAGLPVDTRIFCHKGGKRVTDILDYLYPAQKSSGSSGLFACKVAQHLGFTHLVLCGIPNDNSAGKIGVGPAWHGAENFKAGWQQALPYLTNVRSMSGWTARLLGSPTTEWLTGEAA